MPHSHRSYKVASIFLAVFLFLEPLSSSIALAVSVPSDSAPIETMHDMIGGSANRVLLNTDGSYSHKYPLRMVPGRNGMQPDLELSYSSAGGSDQDPFGYGWSINIPYIARLNKGGTGSLFASTTNDYYSSLSGELVRVGTSSSYKSKVETGSFIKYTLANNAWKATDKNGTTYSFGSTTASRLYDVSSTTRAFKWFIDEKRDTNSNFTSFSYTQDQNQVYPQTITYTGNGAVAGPFQVSFTLESKTIPVTSAATGFNVTTAYRVKDIQELISGSWVRKYSLTYTAGDNGSRDLLSQVTESDRDEAGVNTKTLPADTFGYQKSNRAMSSDTGTFSGTIPALFYNSAFSTKQQPYEVFDVNGDGLADVVHIGSGQQDLYLNDGNYWVATTSWTFPSGIDGSFAFTGGGVRAIDVNGDGLMDLVWSVNTGTSANHGVFINNGTSTWIRDGDGGNWSGTLPNYFWESFTGNGHYVDNGYVFGDVNGDGLPDIIHDNSTGVGETSEVYINTGSGWQLDNSWKTPTDTRVFTFQGAYGRVVDVNGDGLVDLVYDVDNDGSVYKNVYLNNGTSWVPDNGSWSGTLPSQAFLHYVSGGAHIADYGYRFADMNNDGLPDIIFADGSSKGVYLNTGNGWATTTANWTLASNLALSDGRGTVQDINGDGLADIVQSDDIFGKFAYVNQGTKSDLLNSATSSAGGARTITYKGSSKIDSVTGRNENPKSPFAMQVLSTVANDSGFGNKWTDSYWFSDGSNYFTTAAYKDRKFAGFGRVTKTTNLAKIVSYQHQGNGDLASTSESGDHVSKIGYTYRTDTFSPDGKLQKVERSQWQNVDLSDGANFVKQSDALTLDFDGNSDHRDAATSYVYNDINGNLSTQIEYGEVNGSTTGSYSDIGNDKRTTSYTYATNTAAYIIGLPATMRLDDASSTKIKESRYYYDTQVLGSTTKGNLTKKEDWVTGSTYINNQSAYNTYGLKTSDTDPRGNATTYSYDTNNLYPATTTNALSQSTKYTYDYSSGKPLTVTDPNGFVHQQILDPLDRVIEQDEPRSPNGSDVTVETNTYTDTQGAVSVQNTKYLSATNTVDSYTYLDGFGRKVQTRTEDEVSNQFAVKDSVYGPAGMLLKESLPYFQNGSTYTTPSAIEPLYTNYGYDSLGRITGIGTVLGTTSTGYDQWGQTATDTLGHSKTYSYDAFKRLASVIEQNLGSTYTTSYSWTPHDQLATSTDALGNVRGFTYDGLARRLTAQDLHTAGDATFGTWTYAYDAVSNLGTTTNPNGQVVVRAYDALNRQTNEDYTGQSGTEFTLAYDSCTNGKGQLCSITSATSTATRTYNPAALVEAESKTIGGTVYTSTTTYDRQNNPAIITYPDNFQVQYIYDTAGRVTRVDQREATSTFTALITNIDYGPTGAVTYEEHNNGTYTQNTYDPNELYRLKRKYTSKFGTGGSIALTPAEENAAFFASDSSSSIITSTDTPSITSLGQTATDAIVADVFASSSIQTISSSTSAVASDTASSSAASTSVLAAPSAPVLTPVLTQAIGTSTSVRMPAWDPELLVLDGAKREPIADTIGTTPNGDIIKHVRLYPIGANGQKRTRALNGGWYIDDGHTHIKTYSHEGDPLLTYNGINSTQISLYANDERSLDVSSSRNTSFTDGVVTYPSLLKNDVDIEVATDERYVHKNIVLRSKPTHASSSDTYDVSFTIASPDTLDLEVDGKLLSNVGSITTHNAVKLLSVGAPVAYIANPLATDARPYGRPQKFVPIDVTYEYHNGVITATKHIPYSWLDTATYPVRADLTLTVYSGPGDGQANGEPYPSSWATQHDTLSTSAINYTSAAYYVGSGTYNSAGGYLSIQRGFLAFDTSNLPDTATVATATIGIYATQVDDQWNDALSYFAIYHGLQASPTSIISTDYSKCGNAISNPTELSSEVDATGIVLNQYARFPLNAVGTSTISKTGYSQFCIREGHDATNNEPVNYSNVWKSTGVTFNGSEAAGVNTDPYLDITYTDPAGTSTPAIQDLVYAYDSVGNLTSISDNTSTSTTKATVYGYDDLYRLLNVGTTTATISWTGTIPNVSVASSTPYRTWAYNSLGDITSASNKGTYTYAGNTGSLYANPHAPTAVGSTTLTYDKNGQTLTGYSTNTWNYRGELFKVASGTASTTFSYDSTGERLEKKTASSTTRYISPQYELTVGATTTRHIYVNGSLVASIERNNGTSTTYHIHRDHLDSTNVITNQGGNTTETLTYHPYGDILSDTKTGKYTEPNQYIGQDFDPETNLSYLHARYLSSPQGQFTSEDPVFWEIGQTNDGKNILRDPQQANSYSYAGDNPLNNKDATGRSWETFGQGIASPVVYAYNNPLQTVGVMALTTAAVIAAPVTVAVAGAALGGYAIGSAAYGAYSAPDADTRDYYLGQGATAVALTTLGVKGGGASELDVRFSQRTISPNFSDAGTFAGKSVSEVSDGLRSGDIDVNSVPVIYKNINGARVVDNNRSTYALKQAGIPTRKWNWQTANNAATSRINQKLNNNKLPTTGTKNVRVTGGK